MGRSGRRVGFGAGLREFALRQYVRAVGAGRDRGASAVEYGLLAAGVTATFLLGTAGFNGVLAEIFHKALDAIPATTP